MTQLPTDPAENLSRLIRCASVTPADAGALGVMEALLEPMGFACERRTFVTDDTDPVDNLYARRSGNGPHLMFAGHTDVVPPGDAEAWAHGPFSADVADGNMYGRGAVDMKGGIACFVAALARVIAEDGSLPGSVSLLITGDEEGPGVNGTVKLLEWAASRGERWDACLLGEPTNPDTIGDMIKNGRRGSLTGMLTVEGRQGHAAYPHLADNAVRGMIALTDALLDPPLDAGTDNFQPSNLEVTSIDTGNRATNVVPGRVTALFNIRFNDTWTADTLKGELMARLERAAGDGRLRGEAKGPVRFSVEWKEPPNHVFLTRDETLTQTLSGAIRAETGRAPVLSTSGGTSDARFIKDYCPVVEFGLVGKTMHMVDEHVALADLETLTRIYARFIRDWFAQRDAGSTAS